ncbi:hypothetical protein, conserved [Eimeria brunetti]|uniref:Uncharacterized protein n=1 Tax=Eimeria brunetti TaxID=51314 RepID=U6LCW1_9EIME|nr:hypothetical protein, conserved [Eimeria brunetti]
MKPPEGAAAGAAAAEPAAAAAAAGAAAAAAAAAEPEITNKEIGVAAVRGLLAGRKLQTQHIKSMCFMDMDSLAPPQLPDAATREGEEAAKLLLQQQLQQLQQEQP